MVLPDPLGVKEAVVLECTAGKQLHVTATAGRLETSSDQAIVTELFKLAPRQRLTLLQGVAGGWLPKGYTELEYLESSGTQYIDTGEFLDSEWSVTITAANTAPNNNKNSFGLFGFSAGAPNVFALSVYCEMPSSRNVSWVGLGDFGEMFLSWDVDTSLFHTYALNKSMLTFDGSPALEIQTAPFSNSAYTSFLFKYYSTTQNGFIGRVTSCILYNSGRKIHEFIPALRNADGVAGMWDRVSKQFFDNDGTGSFGYRIKGAPATFALRDPHRVAPSGVYARKVGEAELEVLADTEETTGEGWEWFANTAEAYEHFGITQEEFITE